MTKRHNSVTVPQYVRDVLDAVTLNAAAEVGERRALHQTMAAALMVASNHHDEFSHWMRHPMTEDEFRRFLNPDPGE
jgi:hypothetical protein